MNLLHYTNVDGRCILSATISNQHTVGHLLLQMATSEYFITTKTKSGAKAYKVLTDTGFGNNGIKIHIWKGDLIVLD